MFAGIGGHAWGLKHAGAEIVWANEIDKMHVLHTGEILVVITL
ncbi:DNA cytosine methyltransferase [Bacillus sp. 7884-1]|nr:DNA cytosine methyltransferase [Bacillus sp. 7884-1]